MKDYFEIVPVGVVRKNEESTWIEILEKFKDAILNLDRFSHIVTLWWISEKDNENDRAILQAVAMIRNATRKPPLSGVFATRAPVRPNPIGLTIVKLLRIEGNKIYIDRTDAFDGTPIVDIKPYIPKSDCILNTKLPDYFEPLMEKRVE
ncbi:MAG: tRNA (N6-threonylcarbamoyladenosine(37)-N6)-methyltransferase TrmO [Asgard group archaeon]|nr:tRNA (N6-threonylcarbamoyladenosine(37)-N6)-methyltransferase TrmO [Asgard group archaeon]